MAVRSVAPSNIILRSSLNPARKTSRNICLRKSSTSVELKDMRIIRQLTTTTGIHVSRTPICFPKLSRHICIVIPSPTRFFATNKNHPQEKSSLQNPRRGNKNTTSEDGSLITFMGKNGVFLGGSGVLFLLVFAVSLYIYCEKHPEEKLCDNIRNQIGFDKKVNNIPFLALHNVERQKPLEKIHSLFNSDTSMVAIVGNAAEGKTELAKQYARKFHENYHHIWFVQCETWDTDYRNLASQWKLFPHEQLFPSDKLTKPIDIDIVILAVHAMLSKKQMTSKKKSLIIFDNAEAGFISKKLKGQLPLLTDILITSRNSSWPSKVSLSNEEYHLTQDEGMSILKKWIGEKRFDQEEARKIVERFGKLPIILTQIGHYLAKTETMPMHQFLPIFEARKREALSKREHSNQPIDLAVSLQLSLEKLDPIAQQLLRYCAYLPANNIPTNLLLQLLGNDQHLFQQHLSALKPFVIGDRNQVTIPKAFQETYMEEQPLDEKSLSTLAKVSLNFEDFLKNDPSRALILYQQGLHETEKQEKDKEMIEFSSRLGEIHHNLGHYTQALEYHQKAFEVQKKTLRKDHPDMAIRYKNIGKCLEMLGEFEQALNYKQQLLEIVRKTFGEDHPTTASSYDDVGNTLAWLNRREEALEHLQRALDIRRRKLGEDHLDTARSYIYTGHNHDMLGRYEKALEYKQQALEIYRKKLGENHPDTASSYKIVGYMLIKLGRCEEALKNLQKALVVLREQLGEDHLETGVCYHSAGICLLKLERYKEASESIQKALLCTYKNPPLPHSLQEAFRKNFITSLSKLSDAQECQKIREAVLRLTRDKFGKDDPFAQTLEKACK